MAIDLIYIDITVLGNNQKRPMKQETVNFI